MNVEQSNIAGLRQDVAELRKEVSTLRREFEELKRSRRISSVLPLLLAGLAVLGLSGCSSTGSLQTDQSTGGYTVDGSSFYQLKAGTLYGWDGQEWYALRRPQTEAGEIGGATIGGPEQWIKAGGSAIRTYHRTDKTYRNTKLRPVFIAN